MTARGDDPTDAALLQRHVDGDPDAFSELVARHQDRLWAVALRTTGDPDDASDALQEALVSAFRRAGGFRGRRPQARLVKQRGDACGAHAALAARVDLGVCSLEGLLERMRAILGRVLIICREDRFDPDLASDFTGGVAAHAIADDQ